jgi:hypothetical protein
MVERAPWSKSFLVDGSPGGAIRLSQTGLKEFELASTVRYIGEQTGLEGQAR